MSIEQYTYWSMTINNPDENDYLIVRNPNPKYVRELIWTKEVGEQGTEHIQAWLRLQRNQGMAFVKKIYPRGHFKHCDKDVYNENSHQYAQKNDETTAGNHHITLNDPLPANDTLLYKVLEQSWERLIARDELLADRVSSDGMKGEIYSPYMSLKKLSTDVIERQMVLEKSGLEKIFISPAYEKMKAKFWREILIRIYTHKQNEGIESASGIQESASQTEGGSEVCEDYEEGTSEEDERFDESGSSCSGQTYDQSEC